MNSPQPPGTPHRKPSGYEPPPGYRLVHEPPAQHAYSPYASAWQPPIVINNVNSSSASAFANGWVRRPRRQSFWAHFWLFLCTAGIGNLAYSCYISHWNRKYGL